MDDDSLMDLEAELIDRRNVQDEAAGEASSPTIYNISSYGADFSAEQHVKRMKSGAYVVPEFQRSYVWTPRKASRFIESLLLGLPVPSIFLYRDVELGKHLVVDGQQRLRTLHYYFSGVLGEKTFRLEEVHDRWQGRTYEELDDVDKQKLDDAIIHTIIFRQDEPSRDKSSIYHVFERLNTGGMNLNAQEIRTCVSYGSFAKQLRELNKNDNWRAIYGKPSPRMKDQELILRFLALFEDVDNYERPMVEFLNSFMSANSEAPAVTLHRYRTLFDDTIAAARAALGKKAFRPANALNAAVFDACMVGLARAIVEARQPPAEKLGEAYQRLLDNLDFQSAYQRATADKDSVIRRVNLATDAFRVL